jgi:diguanylate cyclase (GGDEF)-like protein
MKIRELMSRQVACGRQEMPVWQATALMRQNRYSCLVIAAGRSPIGVITERDLVAVLAQARSDARVHERPVRDFMSTPPVTIREDADLFEAMVVAQSRGIRHLPVVGAGGRLTGVVTQSDLARAHMRIIETQREIIEGAVAKRTQELSAANERLKALSMEDALLRIGNRRAMEVDLEYTHQAARRYDKIYSLVLFDLDYFKGYNDAYGHTAGDGALVRVVDYLKEGVRKSDRLYRYGGEELLLLLPETAMGEGEPMARRLVEGVARQGFEHRGSPLGFLTLSGGVSDLSAAAGECEWRAVVASADEALYRAKSGGRNRVESAAGASTAKLDVSAA